LAQATGRERPRQEEADAMGLMRWLRGGSDNPAATSAISAGLAEIDGLFRPSKHKQTEHVEQSKRRRVDIGNADEIDLERGVAVIRPPRGADPHGVAGEPPAADLDGVAGQPPAADLDGMVDPVGVTDPPRAAH
jgi:hypothetical protein